MSLLVDLLCPPVLLLRRYICSGRDSDIWINQEESQDLAMARLSRIGKLERLHAVLQDIRKDEKTVFAGQDLSNDLHRCHLDAISGIRHSSFEAELSYSQVVFAVKAKYLPQSMIMVLFVNRTVIRFTIKVLRIHGLPKGKIRVGNVGAVVVVERTGANMFVLEALCTICQPPVCSQVLQ